MYSICPIKVGQSIEPEARVFHLGDCAKTIQLYNYIWLVRGNDRVILGDTGFSLEDGKTINPAIVQTQDEHPLLQLSRRNVKPEAVTDVILTHVHWDHLSPILDHFVNAEIYIQEKEVRYVLDPPHPWFSQFIFVDTVNKLVSDYSDRVHFVNGDEEILPGISVFLAGGHTPGSQVVKVSTKSGKVVLAGDVVFNYRNIAEDLPIAFNCNLEECFLAMKRIREEADIVLPGHDPVVLERYEEIA